MTFIRSFKLCIFLLWNQLPLILEVDIPYPLETICKQEDKFPAIVMFATSDVFISQVYYLKR